MIATLTNAETAIKIELQYLSLGLDAGGVDAQYASDDAPGVSNHAYYWQGSVDAPRSLSFILNGGDVRGIVGELESWARPAGGKDAPPAIVLRLGQLAPKSFYLSKVATTYPLPLFKDGLPTRASINLTLIPI